MTEQTTTDNPCLMWQKAMVEEMTAAAGRMARLPFLLQQAQRVKKGVTPSEVVYEEDRLKLRHYPGEGPLRSRTPLVFIYALVNRPYILDLKRGRSVVANFVERGFDTYLVDWGVPGNADRHLTLDDYINGYMANVLDYLRERTGVERASILGYCMGGTMSAMFTALHPDRVKNLILLAAPIDFADNNGLLALWSRPEYFDVDKFVDAFGNCPPEFLQVPSSSCARWATCSRSRFILPSGCMTRNSSTTFSPPKPGSMTTSPFRARFTGSLSSICIRRTF